MGAAIAGLLIMAVFFTGVLMMFRTTLFGNVIISNSMKEANQLSGEQARTDIRLTGASITTGDGYCKLTVTGDNKGAISISDYDRMDIILQFDQASNAPQALSYNSGNTASTGDWTSRLVAPYDKFEPTIFNAGETITIEGRLSSLVTGDESALVTVGAPTGVTATRVLTSGDMPNILGSGVPCP